MSAGLTLDGDPIAPRKRAPVLQPTDEAKTPEVLDQFFDVCTIEGIPSNYRIQQHALIDYGFDTVNQREQEISTGTYSITLRYNPARARKSDAGRLLRLLLSWIAREAEGPALTCTIHDQTHGNTAQTAEELAGFLLQRVEAIQQEARPIVSTRDALCGTLAPTH